MVSFLPREAQDLSLLASLMTCRPPLQSPGLEFGLNYTQQKGKGGKGIAWKLAREKGGKKSQALPTSSIQTACNKKKKKKEKKRGEKSLSIEQF